MWYVVVVLEILSAKVEFLTQFNVTKYGKFTYYERILFYYIDQHGIFGVVRSSNFLISSSFTLAKRSAMFFFTTNRTWSGSLQVEETIKLQNSSHTVFVYIIIVYILIIEACFISDVIEN